MPVCLIDWIICRFCIIIGIISVQRMRSTFSSGMPVLPAFITQLILLYIVSLPISNTGQKALGPATSKTISGDISCINISKLYLAILCNQPSTWSTFSLIRVANPSCWILASVAVLDLITPPRWASPRPLIHSISERIGLVSYTTGFMGGGTAGWNTWLTPCPPAFIKAISPILALLKTSISS